MMHSVVRDRAKAWLRLGALAFALSALAFAGGSVVGDAPDAAPGGPKFVVSCTGSAPDALTCTLTVSGLPDPLGESINVVLSSSGEVDDVQPDHASAYTTVSAAVLGSVEGVPALVSRDVASVRPHLVPRVPQVPTQPPRYL